MLALKGLDLTVPQGEFVAVMGPSGSGKTTLLNCLSGLDEIDDGRVLVEGHSIHELSDAKRTRHRAETMGFIFQAFNLIPVFTATENVELPLLLARVPAPRRGASARTTLTRVGLGHRLDRRPPSSRAASSSASRSRAHSRAGRGWSGPTSRPATSTRRWQQRSWICCPSCTRGADARPRHHDPNGRRPRRPADHGQGRRSRRGRAASPASTECTARPVTRDDRLARSRSRSLAPVHRRSSCAGPCCGGSRSATRSGGRAKRLLVVLGSLLGAAIITGSIVVGDTMDASIRQVARTHLGPIDELVTARAPAERELSGCLRPLARGDVDGVLAFATIEAPLRAPDPASFARAPLPARGRRLRGGARLRPRCASDRYDGRDPEGRSSGDYRRRRSCARCRCRRPDRRPRVRTPDLAGGRSRPAPPRHRWVLARSGAGRAQRARLAEDVRPHSSRRCRGDTADLGIAVSNRGGVESGAVLTDEVSTQIRTAAAAAGSTPRSTPPRTTLEAAAEVGKGFASMFTAMGSFGVLAGLLLLVNLFVMLAAERKTELGMARAVGMRRSDWSAPSQPKAGSTHRGNSPRVSQPELDLGGPRLALRPDLRDRAQPLRPVLHAEPQSLAQSFAIGFTVALATIVGTSLRVSRLNIIRAIRDLAEPPPRRRRALAGFSPAGWHAVGVAVTVRAVFARRPRAYYSVRVWPSSGSRRSARAFSRRTSYTVPALLVVVWGASIFALVPDSTKGASVTLYVLQGIVLTAAAVTLVSFQQERLSRARRLVTGGRSLSLRLGLAYPLARRSRTGLTIAMYALVVFILTFITSLAHMIDSEVETATQTCPGRVRRHPLVEPIESRDCKPTGLAGRGHTCRPTGARTSGLFRVGDG